MNLKLKAALITVGLFAGVILIFYLVSTYPVVVGIILICILIPGFIALVYNIIHYILKNKN